MVFVEHPDILMNMYWMALIYGIHEIIRMLVGYLVMWKDIIGKQKAPGEHPTEMFYIDQHKWQSIHGLKVGAKMNVTPHISVDLGISKSNISSVEPYVSVMYTLGKSRYAYFGGKHSENVMTSARSKMFDKVKRSDMKVEYYWEQDLRDGPWDHL